MPYCHIIYPTCPPNFYAISENCHLPDKGVIIGGASLAYGFPE